MVTREEKKQLSTATRVVMLTALYFLGGLLGKKTAFLVQQRGAGLAAVRHRAGGDFAFWLPFLAGHLRRGGFIFFH